MVLHACRIPDSNHRAPSLKLCRYTWQQVLNQWPLGQICCNVKKYCMRQFITIKLEKHTVNIGRFHMKCWIFGLSWKTKGLVLLSTFQHQSAGAECSRSLQWGVGCLLLSAHWGWGHPSFPSCPQWCFTYSGEALPPGWLSTTGYKIKDRRVPRWGKLHLASIVWWPCGHWCMGLRSKASCMISFDWVTVDY